MKMGFAMRRSQASAKADHFTCEETPSTDPIVQIAESHASMRKLTMDAIEHVPEFAHGNDVSGRDGLKSSDAAEQGAALRRSQALAKGDHLSSEESPSTDTFDMQRGRAPRGLLRGGGAPSRGRRGRRRRARR